MRQIAIHTGLLLKFIQSSILILYPDHLGVPSDRFPVIPLTATQQATEKIIEN